MPETSPKLNVQRNYDLSKSSTLRVKASAEYLVTPSSLAELSEIFKWIKSANLSWNILGAGSNLLLSSRAIPGVTILTTKLDSIKELEPGLFEVGAGVKMPRFCAYASQKSYTGTEFMEGIPGTIGGGIVMNAGAHGSWMELILESAMVLDLSSLEILEWSKAKLGFSYRHSAVNPQQHLIVSAKFRLKLGDKETIRKKVIENNHHRSTAQPIKSWTCGCTFKNPSDDCKAGLLIQEMGAKGWHEGPIQVSMLHGNFFENTKEGEGTSMDMCKLMAKVQEEASKRGVRLEPEVQRIGVFTPEEDRIWHLSF
jgi:UDP-N-acetylmuramate dehydrogenase